MDLTIIELIAANAAFVGTHFLMSRYAPLAAKAAPLVNALGELGFQVAYSIVSLVTLAWVYFAFKAAPPADLGGAGSVGWILATIITLPAMVLFAGSVFGNPAMPSPQAEEQARAQATGVFTITRHPMMWGFGLWALSHMVLFWSTRTMITAFAIGLLALVGAHLQDLKKRTLMGEAWQQWESNTSFWPQLSGFARAGAIPWILGTALWLAASWLHIWAGGIPAGVFRWV